MAGYRLAKSARRDMAEIWAYIAEDSPENADTFLEALVKRFRMLAQNQYAGKSRGEIQQNLQSFPVSDYLIFYRIGESRIEIVRVVHGRRRLERLFN